MKTNISAMFSGLLFGLGLAISQMINPEKVLAFLDITGNWDPSLMLVLAGAVGVSLGGYHLVLQQPHPLFKGKFYLPTRHDIDLPLLLGAGIFGVGWGIAGYCPGKPCCRRARWVSRWRPDRSRRRGSRPSRSTAPSSVSGWAFTGSRELKRSR